MAAARVLRLRLAVAMILVGALGHVPAKAADEDTLLEASAGSYRGRVVDARTGQPISDAVVVILWQRLDDQIAGLRRLVTAQETFTDAEGGFVHDVRAIEAKLPPRTLAPRIVMFRPGYTPVPDRPQVHPPGVPAARFTAAGVVATMSAVSDYEDRSEAFNTFVAMLSSAQLFPANELPDTAELIRFELLGVRPPRPVTPRGDR